MYYTCSDLLDRDWLVMAFQGLLFPDNNHSRQGHPVTASHLANIIITYMRLELQMIKPDCLKTKTKQVILMEGLDSILMSSSNIANQCV